MEPKIYGRYCKLTLNSRIDISHYSFMQAGGVESSVSLENKDKEQVLAVLEKMASSDQ